MFNKAICHIDLGEPQKAIKALDKALEIVPNYVEALTTKGFAYEKLGEIKKAIDHYKMATKINPFHPYPWISLGNLARRMGREDKAKMFFSKARELGFKG